MASVEVADEGGASGPQMLNFETTDAFEEANAADNAGTGNKVHLRIQARNRRKCVLTVQGLDDDLDLKKISILKKSSDARPVRRTEPRKPSRVVRMREHGTRAAVIYKNA